MRICLIGPAGPLEEGMRQVSFHLSAELGKHHQVLRLDAELRKVLSTGFWKGLRDFDPDLIHYVPGPSIKSFFLVKMLSLHCPHVKTVMSATHPALSPLTQRFVPMVRPDLILTQSSRDEEMFTRLGCKTTFLPSGVDTERFAPVSKQMKDGLRREYGLSPDRFIILHVGSIKEKRNLRILQSMQRGQNQVLIVGTASTGVEQKIRRELEQNDCLVWIQHFKDIERIYALADCYVFPTIDRIAAIALPLSVLEAMSCNLPVISTRFGALPRVFEESDGFHFAAKQEDFIQRLQEVKDGVQVKTREKVLSYSWESIARRLKGIYTTLCDCRPPANGLL